MADKIAETNETVYGKYCLLRVTGFKHRNGTTDYQSHMQSPWNWALSELQIMDDNLKAAENLRQFGRDLRIMTGKGNLR